MVKSMEKDNQEIYNKSAVEVTKNITITYIHVKYCTDQDEGNTKDGGCTGLSC